MTTHNHDHVKPNKQVTPYANAFNYNACTYLRSRPTNTHTKILRLPPSINPT